MKCPFCTYPESKVLETRVADEWDTIRRRRECEKCGKRFTTYERVERSPLSVIKKDGRREVFDREKLLAGIYKACDQTTVPRPEIERIADQVERELRGDTTAEINSSRIGNLVAEELKLTNKIAYIRFASVFRRFVDVEEFENELKRLL